MSPPQVLLPPAVLEASERLVQAAFGARCRVVTEAAEVVGERARSSIHRLSLSGGAIQHVILKRSKPAEREDLTESVQDFCNEWAALQLLSTVAPQTVAPRFFGGDLEQRLLLMEDLGAAPSLADRLLAPDREEAEVACLAYARCLGRLHAATTGKGTAYLDMLRSITGKESPDPWHERVQRIFSQLAASLASAGVELDAACLSEVQALGESLLLKASAAVLTHGDPCPDNALVVDGEMRLIDFEFAGLRPPLVDGAYGRVPFPTCWCVSRLPQNLVSAMETSYREELRQASSWVGDEQAWRRAVVEASAFWLVSDVAEWLLPVALKEERVWGISTFRQRLLMRLPLFTELTREYGHLPALGHLAQQFADRLVRRWPELEPMPLYPAFR
jgi:Phosphotransferase enzyme family